MLSSVWDLCLSRVFPKAGIQLWSRLDSGQTLSHCEFAGGLPTYWSDFKVFQIFYDSFLSLTDRPHVDRCIYSWIWAILLLRLAFLGSSLMFHTSELAMPGPFLRALVFHSSYSSIAGTLLRWGTGCLRKSSVLSTRKYCVQTGKASSLRGVSHYRRVL